MNKALSRQRTLATMPSFPQDRSGDRAPEINTCYRSDQGAVHQVNLTVLRVKFKGVSHRVCFARAPP